MVSAVLADWRIPMSAPEDATKRPQTVSLADEEGVKQVLVRIPLSSQMIRGVGTVQLG
jgi:hypothetical protein